MHDLVVAAGACGASTTALGLFSMVPVILLVVVQRNLPGCYPVVLAGVVFEAIAVFLVKDQLRGPLHQPGMDG